MDGRRLPRRQAAPTLDSQEEKTYARNVEFHISKFIFSSSSYSSLLFVQMSLGGGAKWGATPKVFSLPTHTLHTFVCQRKK